MPTYEYRCNTPKCGRLFEDTKSVAERNTAVCPKCKKSDVTIVISTPYFTFRSEWADHYKEQDAMGDYNDDTGEWT